MVDKPSVEQSFLIQPRALTENQTESQQDHPKQISQINDRVEPSTIDEAAEPSKYKTEDSPTLIVDDPHGVLKQRKLSKLKEESENQHVSEEINEFADAIIPKEGYNDLVEMNGGLNKEVPLNQELRTDELLQPKT